MVELLVLVKDGLVCLWVQREVVETAELMEKQKAPDSAEMMVSEMVAWMADAMAERKASKVDLMVGSLAGVMAGPMDERWDEKK